MNQPSPESPRTMQESLLHQALVMSNALQGLPPLVVALAFAADAAIVGVFWLAHGTADALVVALGVLAFCFGNWALLRRLPVVGRSFGPDQPAALALGAAGALVVLIIGLFSVPVFVPLAALAALTALAVYATWVEPFRITLTRETLHVQAGKADAACLRLLHISDLHVERITDRERRLNAMIAALQPDMIVFTGDFVNLSYTDDPQAQADIRTVIGAWRAPLGVYCIPGTPIVEPLERVVAFVEGLENVTLLANRWQSVETPCGTLDILGMITTHDLVTDRAALARMVEAAPESDASIRLLLAHSPDIAPESAAAGFDLMLCGHTHGGQIRLPLVGALVSSSQLGLRFVMGRYDVAGMTLYVSRGLGMEGYGAPRARFLCPPEIILWEFNIFA